MEKYYESETIWKRINYDSYYLANLEIVLEDNRQNFILNLRRNRQLVGSLHVGNSIGFELGIEIAYNKKNYFANNAEKINL